MYIHPSSPILALVPLAFLTLLSAASSTTKSQQQILGANHGVKKSPFNEEFEKLVNKTLELWCVPGLSIAVVDGEDSWAEGYGIATINSSTRAESSTLYLVGSTTKAFSAAAMSLLVDDNANYSSLQWITPISSILRDDFVLADPHITTHATIEDALSHRTGMPRHDDSYGGLYSGHPMTLRDAVRSLRHLPLTAELRTKWQYCNIMFVVIANIIETVTGSHLEDFISTRILQPLGMKATYFSTQAAHDAPEHFATGYAYANGSYHAVPDFDLTSVSGAGFIVSNVLDYILWLRAMISQSPPISKAGHEALRTPRMLMDTADPYTGPSAYTLGWMTGTYRGYQWFQHSGGMEAYGANVIFFPKLKWGSVAFGNTAGSSNAAEEKLMWYLIDEKLGIAEEERFDWDKSNLAARDRQVSFLSTAKSHFYPTIPSPPLPPSRPASAYEGTYFHPAYHNMTVVLDPTPNDTNSTFTIDRSNQTWATSISLTHISGEFFLAYVDSTTAPGTALFKNAFPAEFRVRKDGVVGAFGARMEPAMGEEFVWFDRIA